MKCKQNIQNCQCCGLKQFRKVFGGNNINKVITILIIIVMLGAGAFFLRDKPVIPPLGVVPQKPSTELTYQDIQDLIRIWNYEIKKRGGEITLKYSDTKDSKLLIKVMNKFVRARQTDDNDDQGYDNEREVIMAKFEDEQ